MTVLSRLKDPGGESTWKSKLRAYDGENLKDVDPKAKPVHEYHDDAGVDEGMTGLSTRFAFKALSKTFNYGHGEVSANPVHLLYILEQEIKQTQFPKEVEQRYLGAFLKEVLTEDYKEFLDKEIRAAFVESYAEYGQNVFDRYILYADHWSNDEDYRDSQTGEMFDRKSLNAELEKIEKPAGISNPKDFRNEVVKYVLRYRANHGGGNPDWKGYQKIKEVIEKTIFASDEVLLPVISFGKKTSEEDEKKHKGFIERMMARGYTLEMVRLLVEWHMRVRKNA